MRKGLKCFLFLDLVLSLTVTLIYLSLCHMICRDLYDYMVARYREGGRSKGGKGETFSLQQLQTAHDEYDEEATLFVFRLKSLKQGQSRSLLTQATRHHASQVLHMPLFPCKNWSFLFFFNVITIAFFCAQNSCVFSRKQSSPLRQ